MLVAHEGPPMAQQKRKKLLTFLAKILRRGLARPNQITDRFMDGVGHPYRCKFTRTQQPRQRHRITPIGFDPLARLLRDERRRHHNAVMTPTNASLYFFMVRPPCLRLGSVHPSNPRLYYCTKGRAAGLSLRTQRLGRSTL